MNHYKEKTDFPGSLVVKNPPAMQETRVWFLSREDPLEKEMPIHYRILAREIPWTEEPGRLQSMGGKRHDLVTKQQQQREETSSVSGCWTARPELKLLLESNSS